MQSKHINTVLAILQNEVDGDTKAAMEKMTDDYTMTWVYETRSGDNFPRSHVNKSADLEDVYHYKGREYDIRNMVETDEVVMLEVIESYPDPDTGQMYRTPQVIVLQLKDGKIQTGRHYCDPRLSFKELTKEEIDDALMGVETKFLVNNDSMF